MNLISILRRPAALLLLLICLTSLFSFSYRIHKNYYVMPIDFLIFLDAGKRFEKTGELYLRTDNYTEKYQPSAAIYKFPPPFQLAFVPLVKLSKHISLLEIIKPLMIVMYILGLMLLVCHISHHLKLDAEQTWHLSATVLIIGCWMMPFFESLRWLLAEIPIFLMFVLVAILPRDYRYSSFISGLLIAYAACIKIYPAFLAGIFLYQRDKAAIAGLIVGTLIVISLSIRCFGVDEHLFYLSTVLPILLTEPVIDKWINLNFEQALFNLYLINKVSGNIFYTLRVIVLLAFILSLYHYRRHLKSDNLTITSFFVTTLYFCFPNYWPQYQIFLLIPLCFLFGNCFKYRSTKEIAVTLFATFPLFVPDLLWARFQGMAESSLGLIFAFLFELRAASAIVIWLLIVRALRAKHAAQLSTR